MDNEDIEQLINDKVNVFWKVVESGSNKRGQVRLPFRDAAVAAITLHFFETQISVTLSDKRPRKGTIFDFYKAGEVRRPLITTPREFFVTDAEILIHKEDVPWEEWYANLKSLQS